MSNAESTSEYEKPLTPIEANSNDEMDSKQSKTVDKKDDANLEEIQDVENDTNTKDTLKDEEDDDLKENETTDKNRKRRRKRPLAEIDDDIPKKKQRKDDDKKNDANDIQNDSEFGVDAIIGWRYINGRTLFNVKWSGYNDSTDMTWEPIQNVAENDKFGEFVTKIQTQLIAADEGGLLRRLRMRSGRRVKDILSDKVWHGDEYDMIALQQIFKIRPKDE